jgi:hypothetical protein
MSSRAILSCDSSENDTLSYHPASRGFKYVCFLRDLVLSRLAPQMLFLEPWIANIAARRFLLSAL